MKKPELVWMCLYLAVTGILLCFAVVRSVRYDRFTEAELKFAEYARLQGDLPDALLDDYSDLSKGTPESKCNAYLHDGTLGLLDDLCDAQKASLRCMIRTCDHSTAGRLAEALLRHLHLCRLLEAVEIPQRYTNYQTGRHQFPPETLKPGEQ